MARKTSARAPQPAGLPSRLRPLATVAGVLACAYATVALISYRPLDPAFSHAGSGDIENVAGPVGAWVADLLHQVVGHGAWVLPGLGLLLVLRLAGRLRLSWDRVVAGGVLFFTLLLSMSMLSDQAPEVADFPAGGVLGLLGDELLVGLVGPAGAWLVVVGLTLGSLTFLVSLDLEKLTARLLGRVEIGLPRVGRAGVSVGRRALDGAVQAGVGLAGRVRGAGLGDADELDDDEYTGGVEVSDPDLDRAAPRPVEAPAPAVAHRVDLEDDRDTRTQVAERDLVEVQEFPTEAGTAASVIDYTRPVEALQPPPAVEAVEAGAAEEAPRTGPVPVIPAAAELPEPRAPRRTEGARGGIEMKPGELVSGGSDDGGLAVMEVDEHAAFELPHLGLLDRHELDVARVDEVELRRLAGNLETKLADFGVKGEVTAIRPGPVITTFEYLPAPGIKIARIAALTDDIAMALKALRVRIVAPIPGKGVVGIEIPNSRRQTVWLRDMLSSEVFRKGTAALPVALGRTVEGKPRIADLSRMPHLLVGGTTGSGKSVGVNAMLMSLLFQRTPEELRLILIDPKMLEFELYRDIPHLLHPVVTDPRLASAALKWACTEMDERYKVLSRWKSRSIAGYNRKLEQELQDWTTDKALRYAPRDWPQGEPPPMPKRLPYIVIVIDELSDLMMVAAKDVEESIIRLAQKARAAGIHVVVATQRPSVNVITGLIKANMPSRVSYQVRTKVDSRTILDQNGAETLLGKGDALFLPPGVSGLERVHGPFCSDEEVRTVTEFLREQGPPAYEADIRVDEESAGVIDQDEYDELYDHAVAYVVRQGKASSSMIQREFKIGYNRAARIIEIMERDGVVGAADGARPRQILVSQ